MGGAEGGAALFPIGAVARKTGLSTHLLRAWERRYGVVEPKRAEGGTRLYDEDDVVKLRLLKRVTQQGHPISTVAGLSPQELLGLLGDEAVPVAEGHEGGAGPLMAECLSAIESMNGARVQETLMRALLVLGVDEFLEELVVPLLRRVGELWAEGGLCPAHEHLFSASVQRVLGWVMEQVGMRGRGPAIVTTTPSGQRHDLGALISGVVAAQEGWRVDHLGADLPAADIARAVEATGASAVALSVVLRVEAEPLIGEVRRLRERVPGEVPIFVGGRGSVEHREALTRAGAVCLEELGALRAQLREVAGRVRREAGERGAGVE